MAYTQKRLTTASKSSPALERLREACLRNGPNGIKTIARKFRIFDDDGNKKLSHEEFIKGLKDYGADLTPDEMKALIVEFDTDRDGSVNFDEFLIKLRPPLSQSRQRIIEKCFKKFDKNADGMITIEDMKGVYNFKEHPKYKSGEFTKEQVFRQFLNNFEKNSDERDGKVTFDEFFNYYTGVSASIDNDAYFDLMMRQSWGV